MDQVEEYLLYPIWCNILKQAGAELCQAQLSLELILGLDWKQSSWGWAWVKLDNDVNTHTPCQGHSLTARLRKVTNSQTPFYDMKIWLRIGHLTERAVSEYPPRGARVTNLSCFPRGGHSLTARLHKVTKSQTLLFTKFGHLTETDS